MKTLSVRLPDHLHRALHEVAQREGISLNQLIMLAVAEKLAVLAAADMLEARARRGSRERFESALAKVPDVPPAPEDQLDETAAREQI